LRFAQVEVLSVSHSCGLPHRWAQEQQDAVPDGEITLPIQEGTQLTHPLISPLPDLIDVRLQDESCI